MKELKKGKGRPKDDVPKSVRYTIRVTEEEAQAILLFAKKEDRTAPDFIRRKILEYIESSN